MLIEILLYAAYPPLLFAISKRPFWGWTIVFLISILGLLSPFSTNDIFQFPFGIPYHSFLAYFPYWWGGVIAAIVFRQTLLRITGFQLLFIWFSVSTAGLLYQTQMLFFPNFAVSPTLYSNLYSIGFGVAVAVSLAGSRVAKYGDVARTLSAPSYSAYAVHFPILGALSWTTPTSALLTVSIATLATYWLIERPSHALAKHCSKTLLNEM